VEKSANGRIKLCFKVDQTMFSSSFFRLAATNKITWKLGISVVAAGVTLKTYFSFSRGVLVDNMDRRHIEATEHLKGARAWGERKAKEREERTPALTPEQREQLNEYLRLLVDSQPEVYPKRGTKVAASDGRER